MKTTAIIVTYSNRQCFLEKVIDRLISFNLYHIVIVNNNSVKECTEYLIALASKKSNITIVTLDKNTGSAFALNRGIEIVCADTESEFIWILDDDNLPDVYALNNIEQAYSQTEIVEKNDFIMASYRIDRTNFRKAVESGDTIKLLGRKNIFRSFHFMNYLINKKKPVLQRQTFGEVLSVPVVPFGGMFLHKDLIKKIGTIDESLVLYSDDYEFCCRLRSCSGKIYICSESVVNELESSWNMDKHFYNISFDDHYSKLYYSLRNRAFLEKKYLITSWPIYIINMLIYSLLVTILALVKFKFTNIKTYYTALYHGLTGKMGYNEKYIL